MSDIKRGDNCEIFQISKNFAGKANDEASKPATFEAAIAATGFGKFNLTLLLIAIPTAWSCIFETTTMSYVFPAAQCDLELSLPDKGLLNAITYAGMISSGFLWGFLCDTLGRRRLLCIGLFLDGVFVLMSSLSQNVTLLLVSKFFGGLISTGPFAALTSYIAEFHCAEYRARTQMILGILFNCGSIMLPVLAWVIFPLHVDTNFIYLDFHSWNLYLLVCSLPAALSAVAFLFMPESPKFLMTVGRSEKALEVFRMVYSINSGKPPDTYPITELVDEIEGTQGHKHGGKITANRTKLQALKEGWQQITPLFFPPYVLNMILVCAIQMALIMSLNTLRLWLPQIYQAINDYQSVNNRTDSLCEMLEVFGGKNITAETTQCVVNVDNSFVYINTIIIACTTIGFYVIASFLINLVGKKRILLVSATTAGCCAVALYFASNNAMTTTLSSIFISMASICTNIMLTVAVDLFPTSLRTLTVSVVMAIGRSGAVIGNLLFPILLQLGCGPPFLFVGSVLIFCALLTCILPNTDLKPLV